MVRSSPLEDRHRALGARFTDFGGWSMPLSYPEGTLHEHTECRTGGVLFDVSHLGTVRVEGEGALEALQVAFTNDLTRVGPGRAQYTHLLDDDGSVLDDIIVWWVAEHSFAVIPNASNTDRVRDATGGADVTAERALIAVQGPDARRRLAGVMPAAAAVPRFAVSRVEYRGRSCTVAGTGYTGEHGVEIAVESDLAGALWDELLGAGLTPAGLGARDTLRLEAGLPLHGHELGPGITPLQAGLGWVVAWSKPRFRGREALLAERERGPARLLRGVAAEGRRPPRAGDEITTPHGDELGVVTSGNYSPVLGHGIALGFVPPESEVGDAVLIHGRGEPTPGALVKTPFVKATPSTWDPGA